MVSAHRAMLWLPVGSCGTLGNLESPAPLGNLLESPAQGSEHGGTVGFWGSDSSPSTSPRHHKFKALCCRAPRSLCSETILLVFPTCPWLHRVTRKCQTPPGRGHRDGKPRAGAGIVWSPTGCPVLSVVLCSVISSCGFWKPSVLLPLLALVAQ